MNVASLIKHLEANVVEELGAKKAALQSIKAQELAITERDPDALEKTMDAMNSILPGDTSRAKRRTRLIAELSELWKVPADALTLGAIVRRLGPEGERLEKLRGELRQAVAEVLKRNRRLSSLIGMHRRVNNEIISVVLGVDDRDQLPSSGTLVDAEA
jgi:hypothetical protein